MNTIEKLDPNFIATRADDGMDWYDAVQLGIGGRGWPDTASPYSRIPENRRGFVTAHQWTLGQHSTGLYVRFTTRAGKIGAKWSLLNSEIAMPHMPATGVSGLDLYVRDRGKLKFAGNGRPAAQIGNNVVLSQYPDAAPDESPREFLLYLSLYNGITDLKIGVPHGAKIEPAPPWPGLTTTGKPILFYGTSITQGGCTARPGMNFTSIIGRMLDRDVINLGFSGNGQMFPEIAPLLAEIDASIYVLDSIGNMSTIMTRNCYEQFILTLRNKRPDTPIVLPEMVQNERLLSSQRALGYELHNRYVREAYGRLIDAGIKGLHLVPFDARFGYDYDATVDGIHPNDLGYMRMARTLAYVLAPLG